MTTRQVAALPTAHEKTPGKQLFPGVFLSEAEGTRTPNHRIDCLKSMVCKSWICSDLRFPFRWVVPAKSNCQL